MAKNVKRSTVELLHEGEHLRLLKVGHWEYADRTRGTGVVAIIAVTAKHELVLTEQYRIPVGLNVIDLPAGLVGDEAEFESEEFLTAAERELLEETGFKASQMQPIFTGPASPGMVTEMLSFYVASGCEQVEAGGGDDTEEIETHVVPIEGIREWIDNKVSSSCCVDPKVFAALGVLQVYGM